MVCSREIEIDEDQFNALWNATEGKRIEKTRYEIPHEDGVIELDVYHGGLDGLVTAEMEFDSEEKSDKFSPPEWFGEEVTGDKKYKNQQLAMNEDSIKKDVSIISESVNKVLDNSKF